MDDRQRRDAIADASFISLARGPATPSSQALTDHVAVLVAKSLSTSAATTGGRKVGLKAIPKLTEEVGAILGGLLICGPSRPYVAVQRRDGAALWRLANKPPMGKERFWKLAEAMTAEGLVEEIPAIRFLGSFGRSDGKSTRLGATEKLRTLAGSYGCDAETRSTDWGIVREPPPPPVIAPADLVEFRDWPDIRNGRVKVQGKRHPFPPNVLSVVAGVEQLNRACDGLVVTGCARPRFTRIYGPTLFHGGRFYATGQADSFQKIRKEERRRITIDGEPVAEVDLKAAFLSIFLAYAKAPAPDADPYAIGGLPRETVKRFIVLSLQSGQLKRRWPSGESPTVRETPIKALTEAVKARYPALADVSSALPPEAMGGLPSESHRAWAAGQFLMSIEAQVVSRAISSVLDQGSMAWPMHDGLIVPVTGVEVARKALERAFWERLDRLPMIEVIGAEAPPSPE